ncbi:acetyltransferase [Pseudoalteromonas luteoviolacea]|uniref:acetyltransferase n=1 Tax=Pseudoalteromonas luteoviolacea TaxID=43657 RepID=UPI001F22D87F|nr:acetyltransferase [Pseudoalteromonas luteoviolacea]MCF6439038.1 acetyltransferase [Pseudoalteromonas luteoviolacea]
MSDLQNKSRLAVLGASGHGKVVAEIAELNGYEVIFYDDAYPDKQTLAHWSIEGNSDALKKCLDEVDGVAIGIGNNLIRQSKYDFFKELGAAFPVLIHPNAIVSKYAQLGEATVVMAGASINPFALVGTGCIINTKSVVEHDCQVGSFVHICPNSSIAGHCEVGDLAWFGIGSNAIQQISVGKNSIVGAGSVIIRDVPENVTVVGSPAKVIRK